MRVVGGPGGRHHDGDLLADVLGRGVDVLGGVAGVGGLEKSVSSGQKIGHITWKGLGLGLEFVEVATAAEAGVRIGFDQSDGSWSYVGKDLLAQPQGERTMNYG